MKTYIVIIHVNDMDDISGRCEEFPAAYVPYARNVSELESDMRHQIRHEIMDKYQEPISDDFLIQYDYDWE